MQMPVWSPCPQIARNLQAAASREPAEPSAAFAHMLPHLQAHMGTPAVAALAAAAAAPREACGKVALPSFAEQGQPFPPLHPASQPVPAAQPVGNPVSEVAQQPCPGSCQQQVKQVNQGVNL